MVNQEVQQHGLFYIGIDGCVVYSALHIVMNIIDLISVNWKVGNEDLVDAIANISKEGEEGAKDEEEEEKPNTKVTHSIVFVTAEAAPYSKTGGLGDVCGSLPITLANRGHRVMVISPKYLNGSASDKNFDGAVDTECKVKVSCFGGTQEVQFYHEYKAGVDWVCEQLLPYSHSCRLVL